MLDFDALVFAVTAATFARPITVYPVASQPGQPAYTARGIWSAKPVEIATEDGIVNSVELTLDLRVAEFPIMVRQKDRIAIPASGTLPAIGTCQVEDVDIDGQGSALIKLKLLTNQSKTTGTMP